MLRKNIAGSLLGQSFVTYSAAERLQNLWNLDADGEFMTRPLYLDYESEQTSLAAAQTIRNRNLVLLRNRETSSKSQRRRSSGAFR